MSIRIRKRPCAPPVGLGIPESAEVTARSVTVGGRSHMTSAVVSYPREARLGWLEPMVTHRGALDVSLHVEPIPAQLAMERLRRQLARLESSRRIDAAKGRLEDPAVEVSTADARDLAERVARGEGRLFSLGLYATVSGADDDEAATEAARLGTVLGSQLIDVVPTTFRSMAGWLTTRPLGLDLVRLRRTVDTQALAAAFPFASAELSDANGILYGLNARSRGVVFWDRFAQPNFNSVILARSGAGKSYLAKLELLRLLFSGVEAAVIDPEGEYGRLCEAVGGTRVRLGAPGVRVNPFDLNEEPDALTRRALFLHTLVAVLLGAAPSADEQAALDRAVLAAYHSRGITSDPRTHQRPVPVMADLERALGEDDDPAARSLRIRLAPFVSGSHRMMFDGPTSTAPAGHLVVFSLRDLPDELRPAAGVIVLDAIWRRVTDPARRAPRLVVVDEAWSLMGTDAGATFLFRLAKSARKHWCGLSVVTQDAADLLASPLGQAVVANSATQVLLSQSSQAVHLLSEAFRLSEGEQSFLLAAQRGQGLLLGDGERVAFEAVASEREHRLVTTDPAELHEEQGR